MLHLLVYLLLQLRCTCSFNVAPRFSSSVIPNNVMNLYNLLLVVAFVVIVVLPFLTIHSMVFLQLFVVLLLQHFLFQIPDVSTIFRLPSVPISLINIPMDMYFYCCSWCCPSIYMVLCCIHLINTWISEVLAIVLHLILPYHSMVFLFSFVLLLLYDFLFLALYADSIYHFHLLLHFHVLLHVHEHLLLLLDLPIPILCHDLNLHSLFLELRSAGNCTTFFLTSSLLGLSGNS